MLGAIIGDMVGSVYEFKRGCSKDFDIYNKSNKMTDDSLLTLAVAKVLIDNYPIDYSNKGLNVIKEQLKKEFIKAVNENPFVGWGSMFFAWATNSDGNNYVPYNSFGNGSAMRISPVGWIANSIEEVKILSKAVTEITHNHQEGIKGAEAIAVCIYLARNGSSINEIRNFVQEHYYPEIQNFDFDVLRMTYRFNATCQKSVPQAIYCFLVSSSLEDTIRNCVAIGGDTDTIGAMAGAIAEAYYQKDEISNFEQKFISQFLTKENKRIIKKLFTIIGNHKYDDEEKNE